MATSTASATIGTTRPPSNSTTARRGLSSPPSLLNSTRLFTRLSAGYAQEQKMAELRAAYASPQPQQQQQQQSANGGSGPFSAFFTSSGNATNTNKAATPKSTPRNAANNNRGTPTRSSLPFATSANAAAPTTTTTATNNIGLLDFCMVETGMNGRRRSNGAGSVGSTNSNASSRRGSAIANCVPTPSIMDLAASAGLLSLSPSDLVFESSVLGIAYYDFILSVSEVIGGGGGNFGTPCAACSSASSSSCSSSTTIKEHHNHHQQQLQRQSIISAATSTSQCSPASKRRICTTGSEPAPNNKDVPQRPGTSMGIERAGSTNIAASPSPSQHLRVDAVPEKSAGGATSAFAKCVYRLFLAKLDVHTNVEWFESVIVPGELLEQNGIPANELSLLTMGILVWRSRLANSRLLCLANGQLGEDSTIALEALKRAAGKYKCMHHVLTVGQRRQSASSTHSSCSTSSFRSSCSSSGSHGGQQDAGMKLRVLMCQTRSELSELPAQTLRDAKFLLAPNSNPLLCLCFPLT